MNSKLELINEEGEDVIPCEFDYIASFSNDFAKVFIGELYMSGEPYIKKYWLFAMNGEKVMACKYDNIESLNESLLSGRGFRRINLLICKLKIMFVTYTYSIIIFVNINMTK